MRAFSRFVFALTTTWVGVGKPSHASQDATHPQIPQANPGGTV